MHSITIKLKTLFEMIGNNKYKYIYAGLRRRFIFYFAKGYLNTQLAKRKGGCLMSAQCCKLTIPWCSYLKDDKCSIYDNQPFFCRIFPIDERDKELSDVKKLCGYSFDSR